MNNWILCPICKNKTRLRIRSDSEAAVSTKDAIENEIVKTMDVYKDGKICYLGHPNVWYTSEGGVQALDMMLDDLETFLFPAQA